MDMFPNQLAWVGPDIYQIVFDNLVKIYQSLQPPGITQPLETKTVTIQCNK